MVVHIFFCWLNMLRLQLDYQAQIKKNSCSVSKRKTLSQVIMLCYFYICNFSLRQNFMGLKKNQNLEYVSGTYLILCHITTIQYRLSCISPHPPQEIHEVVDAEVKLLLQHVREKKCLNQDDGKHSSSTGVKSRLLTGFNKLSPRRAFHLFTN